MLVLTRKYQEKIRIGDHITITVLRTKGKGVRLGIEAPKDVPVVRGELLFDSAPDGASQAATNGETATSAGLIVADDTPRASKTARSRSHWSTESRAERSATLPPGSAPTHVSFQRVPRRQLAESLPRTPSAAGPLREMLERRSVTS